MRPGAMHGLCPDVLLVQCCPDRIVLQLPFKRPKCLSGGMQANMLVVVVDVVEDVSVVVVRVVVVSVEVDDVLVDVVLVGVVDVVVLLVVVVDV